MIWRNINKIEDIIPTPMCIMFLIIAILALLVAIINGELFGIIISVLSLIIAYFSYFVVKLRYRDVRPKNYNE